MSRFRFKALGVEFAGSGAWRYVVAYRYAPDRRAIVEAWHGFRSVDQVATAHHVFERTTSKRKGADVYLLDTERGEVIAHAQHGRIISEQLTNNETETGEC